jgi:hypothetical protein
MAPERHVSQSLMGCTHLNGATEHFTNLTPGAQASRQISRRGLPVWTRQRQRCRTIVVVKGDDGEGFAVGDDDGMLVGKVEWR